MRGAYIATLLLVSIGALTGCATSGQESAQPNRPAKQPVGFVQDGVRWIVCGGALACRQRTPKILADNAALSQRLEGVKVLAVMRPTDENARRYIEVQKKVYDFASSSALQSPSTPFSTATAMTTVEPLIKPQSTTPPDVISHDAAMSVRIPQPVTQPPAPTRVVVHFSHNSSYLDVIARRALDGLPITGVLNVRAYTDSTGSDRYNAWLSARRAERVKEYVIRRGVEPQRVRIEALGECCFVASNESPEGRAANRRIEIVISKQT